MLLDSYKQENNYLRKYKLINVNEGINLIPFIKTKELTYSKFKQEKDGAMSANSMSFTLTFPYNKLIIDTEIDVLFIDDMILKELFIDDISLKSLEKPYVTKKIKLEEIVKKDDIITLITNPFNT